MTSGAVSYTHLDVYKRQAYPGANNARRITFEYVMLKDKNDSDADARELVRLIKQYKLPAKVNLRLLYTSIRRPRRRCTAIRRRCASSLPAGSR